MFIKETILINVRLDKEFPVMHANSLHAFSNLYCCQRIQHAHLCIFYRWIFIELQIVYF